jgi:ABC-type bacteriocin/lantibiotic exporter with double-glycine peptidase domain
MRDLTLNHTFLYKSRAKAGGEGGEMPGLDGFLSLYAGASLLLVTFAAARSAVMASAAVRGGSEMHRRLTSGLLGAPTEFFNSIPSGWVLARVTQVSAA